ncbi:MAG TPA: hypothetical protein DCQ06_08650 [Myxococcales bacterium]|nr:hypothetical protein [Myxococcales bacterium]
MVLPTSEDEDAEMEYYEVVNPEIIDKSGEISFEEGCLSFPGVTVAVVRASHVVMRYQDRTGQSHEKDFDGIGAVCAQHELDHLDGLTFLDRVSPLKRRLTLRAYKKAQAQARLDAEEDGQAAIRWR